MAPLEPGAVLGLYLPYQIIPSVLNPFSSDVICSLPVPEDSMRFPSYLGHGLPRSSPNIHVENHMIKNPRSPPRCDVAG